MQIPVKLRKDMHVQELQAATRAGVRLCERKGCAALSAQLYTVRRAMPSGNVYQISVCAACMEWSLRTRIDHYGLNDQADAIAAQILKKIL